MVLLKEPSSSEAKREEKEIGSVDDTAFFVLEISSSIASSTVPP